MSDIGKIGWLDLTVDNAESLSEFYQSVIGWEIEPVSMGDYNDFNMTTAGQPVAGVCHARGGNQGIPPQWIMYVTVADIEQGIAAAGSKGGEIIKTIANQEGRATMAFVRDPAGAVFALYQS